MRQVRLFPKEVCEAVHRLGSPLPGEALNEFGVTLPLYGQWRARGDGRTRCRCCGYPITKGDAAWQFTWNGDDERQPVRGLMHQQPCRWGRAHDEVIVKSNSPASEKRDEAFERGRLRKSAQNRHTTQLDKDLADEVAARSGPVLVRRVDPETLHRGRPTELTPMDVRDAAEFE